MTRIILVRHGETTWNIEGRYQGQEDTPLSERGLKQGHLLADGLRNIPIDLAISSPLQRSYQTCKFCADLHNLPVATDERLLEINHGSWEGVLAGDIQKQYPVEFNMQTIISFEEIASKSFFTSTLDKTLERAALILAAVMTADKKTTLTIEDILGKFDMKAVTDIINATNILMPMVKDFFKIPDVEPKDEPTEEGEENKEKN